MIRHFQSGITIQPLIFNSGAEYIEMLSSVANNNLVSLCKFFSLLHNIDLHRSNSKLYLILVCSNNYEFSSPGIRK